jgi:hypothetical protein
VYRNRAEIQENNIKRMIAHGALNINYGIKKIGRKTAPTSASSINWTPL